MSRIAIRRAQQRAATESTADEALSPREPAAPVIPVALIASGEVEPQPADPLAGIVMDGEEL